MIRIVIAEDQEMILGVIGSLLNLEEDMEVVGHAKNGREAITLVQRLQPDLCMMDIDMPEMNGLDAAHVLRTEKCKVIILTTFAKKGNTERLLNAGVKGYFLKDSPSEELVSAIRSIMNGTQIYAQELLEENKSMDILIHDLPAKRNTVTKIRNYFTTIVDKIKQPTG